VAGAAGIDNGGDSRAHSENVRINAKGPKAFHEMEMNVDQSGGDDMVFDVDHRCTVNSEVSANRLDLPIADADIEYAIPASGGVDNAATLKNEVGQLANHRCLIPAIFSGTIHVV
jgi:hypothetical protein